MSAHQPSPSPPTASLCRRPADGQPIRSDRDKKAIYEVVKAHLMGTSVQQQALLAAASGTGGSGELYGPAGGAAVGVPAVAGSLHDPQQQSILVRPGRRLAGAQLIALLGWAARWG